MYKRGLFPRYCKSKLNLQCLEDGTNKFLNTDKYATRGLGILLVENPLTRKEFRTFFYNGPAPHCLYHC